MKRKSIYITPMLEAQINNISETFNKGVVGLIEIGIAARKEAIDRIASQAFPQAAWVDILQSLNGVEMTASNAPLLIVANLEDYYALDMPSDSSKAEREAAIEALKAMPKSDLIALSLEVQNFWNGVGMAPALQVQFDPPF